ncbi:MAG: hypothetical protein P4L16_04110 [Chlamydiales bacterium]|nr:hypothetical protein [Chlamydiales bacterium]
MTFLRNNIFKWYVINFNICLYALLVILLNINVSATETCCKEKILIYAHEADEELEQNKNSSLAVVLFEFTAKKGTLVRLEGDAAPYALTPGDVVFPACSGGKNRSQTLWNLLRPYNDKITLMPPHATRYGFDPYNARSNWHRTSFAQKKDEFVLWVGIEKCQKFGWNIFESWLSKPEGTPDELAIMLEYYNKHYYNPNLSPGTKRIYIVFAKNAHVHLYRLNQTNKSLEDVVVLFFPLKDLIAHPLPSWNTYPRSVKSYRELANILKCYLDFSKLCTKHMECCFLHNGLVL